MNESLLAALVEEGEQIKKRLRLIGIEKRALLRKVDRLKKEEETKNVEFNLIVRLLEREDFDTVQGAIQQGGVSMKEPKQEDNEGLSRVKPGKREAQVLALYNPEHWEDGVFRRGVELTTPEMNERLTDIRFDTLRSMISRMFRTGILARRKAGKGRQFLYAPKEFYEAVGLDYEHASQKEDADGD